MARAKTKKVSNVIEVGSTLVVVHVNEFIIHTWITGHTAFCNVVIDYEENRFRVLATYSDDINETDDLSLMTSLVNKNFNLDIELKLSDSYSAAKIVINSNLVQFGVKNKIQLCIDYDQACEILDHHKFNRTGIDPDDLDYAVRSLSNTSVGYGDLTTTEKIFNFLTTTDPSKYKLSFGFRKYPKLMALFIALVTSKGIESCWMSSIVIEQMLRDILKSECSSSEYSLVTDSIFTNFGTSDENKLESVITISGIKTLIDKIYNTIIKNDE